MCSHPPTYSAYQTASALPVSALGADPYLKLSGIAAVLAEVAPERRAKEVLQNVWEKGDPSTSALSGSPGDGSSSGNTDWAAYTLTNEERLRRVAVACKLAELCADEEGEEEETWLSWSVEQVLGLAGLETKSGASGSGPTTTRSDNASTSVVLAELALPTWMRRVDLGAPLAALGSVYARKGNVE